MPKRLVNNIDIMYEAYGKGETIVYLQSPFGGINPGAYYAAGKLSSHNRVIIWDSPNTGQSGVVIKDTISEWHLLCEYLKGLLDILGENYVHLVGCSGGGELGLLFTHLYPSMVKSLAMYRPTDTTSCIEKEIIKARYLDLAKIAKKGTIKDVIEYSKNPPNSKWSSLSKWFYNLYLREENKILQLNSKEFYKILTQWALWMGNDKFYRANLNDDDIKNITIPVMIASCADKYHPEEIAIELKNALPNSIYYPSTKYREDEDIYDSKEDEHSFGGFVEFMEKYSCFLSEK